MRIHHQHIKTSFQYQDYFALPTSTINPLALPIAYQVRIIPVFFQSLKMEFLKALLPLYYFI